MAIFNAAQASVKTVGDPNAAYESIYAVWQRARAVCNGERFVKDYDNFLDVINFNNLLIPFSPTMQPIQYNFYKAEAELPGITSQFAKMLVGGLLRKTPVLELPEDIPAYTEIYDWIMNFFGKDDSSLSSFLDAALWEELQTNRCWVFVDYPNIANAEALTEAEKIAYKPYPVIYDAEKIINWHTSEDDFGRKILKRVIVRGLQEIFEKNEFHPEYRDTVWVHELNEKGLYQIRIFQRMEKKTDVPIQSGELLQDNIKGDFKEIDKISNLMINGKPLDFIPAWPLNGSIDIIQPAMTPIIDKEISLYNKLSRRNHLLYGASTYTPIIISDMTDDDFQEIVGSGLGTWIHLRQGDDAKVLETPTAALTDMDRAIAATIEEMAKLGIRMLTPETDQSGIALEIRNAAQTAQLGSLNNKISHTMRQIISFMINWRYGIELPISQIKFSLSPDFNPVPLGADWLRLATEWYQQGLIPRSAWLVLLKHNDILDPDYNDEEGKMEIQQDLELAMKVDEEYATRMENATITKEAK